MDASRAATGMFEVFATRAVRFIIDTVSPSTSIVSCQSKQLSKNIYSTFIVSFQSKQLSSNEHCQRPLLDVNQNSSHSMETVNVHCKLSINTVVINEHCQRPLLDVNRNSSHSTDTVNVHCKLSIKTVVIQRTLSMSIVICLVNQNSCQSTSLSRSIVSSQSKQLSINECCLHPLLTFNQNNQWTYFT